MLKIAYKGKYIYLAILSCTKSFQIKRAAKNLTMITYQVELHSRHESDIPLILITDISGSSPARYHIHSWRLASIATIIKCALNYTYRHLKLDVAKN